VRAEGTKHFAAPRHAVYEAATDPKRFARTVPGVESIEIIDDDHYTVRARIRLGLTSLRMTIQVERREERPPEHARLHGSGRGLGGSIAMDTSFDLSEDGDRGTEMRYVIEIQLGGRIGSLGGRVLQPVFHLHVDHVLRALERELGQHE
jgi:carbon monoxide dehydrogenase subunit G